MRMSLLATHTDLFNIVIKDMIFYWRVLKGNLLRCLFQEIDTYYKKKQAPFVLHKAPNSFAKYISSYVLAVIQCEIFVSNIRTCTRLTIQRVPHAICKKTFWHVLIQPIKHMEDVNTQNRHYFIYVVLKSLRWL